MLWRSVRGAGAGRSPAPASQRSAGKHLFGTQARLLLLVISAALERSSRHKARMITAAAQPDDDALEATIRPKRLAEYLGQQTVREQLSIYIEAARKRGGALDHVLIFGPPGLGKTTLSHVIANELGVNLRSTSGPVLERAGDLAALLTNLEANDVLF